MGIYELITNNLAFDLVVDNIWWADKYAGVSYFYFDGWENNIDDNNMVVDVIDVSNI